MAELKSQHLIDFERTALQGAVSTNYQYRIYGTKILNALGIAIPQAPHRPLSATYSMTFPSTQINSLSWLPSNHHNHAVNWHDASSVMAVASHWCRYLSYCTDIEKRTLDHRALNLMKKYGSVGDDNNAKDNSVNHHYDQIGLRFPYRKAHAQAALNGMLEVAAELMDSGVIDVHYDDDFFTSINYGNIHIEARRRPDFIQRLSEPEEWKVKNGWLESPESSPRLCESLPFYEEMMVIGEYSHIKKVGDNPAMEEYESKVSFCETVDTSGVEIFSKTAFMRQMSEYLTLGTEDPEVILLRGGYYTDFTNKSHWITFNPALAFKLGWRPSGNELLAWNNGQGDLMVKSVYWQSGNVNCATRDHYEVGEGWIVVASADAIDALRKVSNLYIHKKVMRRMGDDETNMSHRFYKVEEMK